MSGLGEQRREQRGHAVEDRRPVLLQALEHGGRRRALGHQDGRGADRHREGQRIARDRRQRTVSPPRTRGRPRVCPAPAWRRVRPSGSGATAYAPCPWAFRSSPRSTARSRRRRRWWAPARSGGGVAISCARDSLPCASLPDTITCLRNGSLPAACEQRRKRRQQLLRHDQRLGAAVVEHELVVRRGQQRVAGDGHDAGFDRAEEHAGEIDGIQKRQHDAVFHPQAKTFQRVGGAVGAFGQLAVGDAAGIVDECGLARAPGAKIALEQVVRGVVVARNAYARRADSYGRRTIVPAFGSPRSVFILESIRSCPRAASTGSARDRSSPSDGAPSLEDTPANRRHDHRTWPPGRPA